MTKKNTYVPPFLEVMLRADGKTLVRVERQEPTLITAEKFLADMTVHPDTRRLACAITFIETAIALIGDDCFPATSKLRGAVARLIIQDTPWGEMTEDEPTSHS